MFSSKNKKNINTFGLKKAPYQELGIYHEIFYMIIHSFPLIQEGQLSVSGKEYAQAQVNHLVD